mmetsp:Transcript_40440/g.53236  ORF Transcript_40440/g.53236 Transcript_40440/m.53236 type:complete len:85 (+) Transcript_40440:788-1042(+)
MHAEAASYSSSAEALDTTNGDNLDLKEVLGMKALETTTSRKSAKAYNSFIVDKKDRFRILWGRIARDNGCVRLNKYLDKEIWLL